jgi:hypothetical protein
MNEDFQQPTQETILDLVAREASASLQVDGLDPQAALEAAGASEDQAQGVAAAMSLGKAVYQALVGQAPTTQCEWFACVHSHLGKSQSDDTSSPSTG